MLGDDADAGMDNDALWNTLLAPVTAWSLDSAEELESDGPTEVSSGKSLADVLETTTEGVPLARAATPTATGRQQQLAVEPDAVSLAFVFDSTGSMWDDLEQLKKGAEDILNATLSRPDKPIHDFVFVPFNDPGDYDLSRRSCDTMVFLP